MARVKKAVKPVPKSDVHPKVAAMGITGYLAGVLVYAMGRAGYEVEPQDAVMVVGALMVVVGWFKRS